MIKLVIIDFDDTLCMTEKSCFYMENETARQLGFEPMTRETHQKNWGKPIESAIVERIPGIDPKAFMKKLDEVHGEYVTQKKVDVITEENLQALQSLLKANRRLAILTSRTYQEVKHLLHENHPLMAHVEKFYHKDNSTFIKPDPRVFINVLTDFRINPNEAVYIGDSISDSECAKNAGLHFIAVLESGLRKKEDFETVPVDYFATTFVEAVEYLLKQ